MADQDSAAIAAEGEEAQTVAKAKQARERSSIGFPYGDLDAAVQIVRTVHEQAGFGCTDVQLAGWLRQSPKSGALLARLATARTFGLIETLRGNIKLTELGQRMVDELRAREARAEAFLHVPLYGAVHEKYKGYPLPPAAALEHEMVNFGVSSKQTGKARQAFERSAQQAGFFAAGTDRLIPPAFAARPETKPLDDGGETLPEGGKNDGTGGGPTPPGLHPFVQGLLQALPEPETDWPVANRAKWLQTAANIFDLIYEGDGGIKIETTIAQRSLRPRDAE